MTTLQVQTILYKNEKEPILRFLESIKQALIVAKIDAKRFDIVKFVTGMFLQLVHFQIEK